MSTRFKERVLYDRVLGKMIIQESLRNQRLLYPTFAERSTLVNSVRLEHYTEGILAFAGVQPIKRHHCIKYQLVAIRPQRMNELCTS